MQRRFLFGLGWTPVTLAIIGACSSSSPDTTKMVVRPDASAGAGDAGEISDAESIPDVAWDHPRIPYESGTPATVARVPVVAETMSTHVDTEQLMFAAGEMQISGEPFAEFFGGRNLNNYDRTLIPPDEYVIPGAETVMLKDLFGFSTAVESYEYSKYYMNMVVQETGAGISLANGPVVTSETAGAAPQDRLVARVDHLLQAVGNDIAGYSTLPPPVGNPRNVLGFGGLTPSFAPYKGFDPAMMPTQQEIATCNAAGGYGGIPTVGQEVPEYECEYNELNLPDSQLDHVLVPSVLGFAQWKQALWSIDFAGRLHDSGSNPVNAVAPADMALVGTAGNTVLGTDPPGAVQGTYLGSTPLEGMWGDIMLANQDNLAEFMLSQLTTADGTTLGGFADKKTATAYDYTSPLRWFPAATSVVVDATQHFPTLTSMTITDGSSRVIDLAAQLVGNAMFFAETDPRNVSIGQRIGMQLTFDGDPFASDNGVADGEDSPHDRALAVMRVAFVNLDRIHSDPTLGVFMDTATIDAGTQTITRGNTLTTSTLAHALIGVRQTLLSVNAAITQYGAADPDPAADVNGILNVAPIHPPGATPATTFSSRLRSTFTTNATFVRDVLTTTDGHVFNGVTVANGVPTPITTPATIESQTAAARALTEAFLVTNDETFRTRARAVVSRVLSPAFYSAAARMFRGVDSQTTDQITMTPATFAWLQSALRETHKVLYVQDDPVLGRVALEATIARVNKLFLNGWDDLNGNETVDGETMTSGLPSGAGGECLAGRLQLGEQSLTGELGLDDFGRHPPDRDGDCVVAIPFGQTGSVQASEVNFHSP